jgi:transposase
VAAILSVIESCRRLRLPVREYLASILPGLANRSVQLVSNLTPAAWASFPALITIQPSSSDPGVQSCG